MSPPASVLPSRPPQPGQNPVPGGSRFLGGSRPEQGRGLFITFAMQKGLETLVSRPFRGGDKRDRTADLLNAIQALSQYKRVANPLNRVGRVLLVRGNFSGSAITIKTHK